jgi:outer membrane protein assembly factor BamB
MERRLPASLVLAAAMVLGNGSVRAQDWPQFRGPDGQGHSDATGLPLTWSETENVAWKTAVPGLGWSSPVIRGDRIWLTTAVDEGHSLRAVSIDRTSGRIVHDVEVIQVDDPGSIHSKNSHASPTAILDGDRVFVHYGAFGTACVSADGKVLWRNTELDYAHNHGPGGSPVLYDDLLIISCDGTDVQFVVALDKATGKIRWKKDRDGPMAFCTPLVIRVNGADQVVSPGGDQVVAYDPRTGDEIWRCRYDGYSVVPRPVFGHGLVFFSSGYNNPVLYAVRADGQGDVTETHVAWSFSRQAPHNPSPLLVGDELYTVSDRGMATCLDAKSGEEHWQERLEGGYSASPLFADGRIYFLNETGACTVIAPGVEFEQLATNQVDGRTLASLAVYEKALYLRTDTHLYRIEKRQGE